MSHFLRCRRSTLLTRPIGSLILAQVWLVASLLGADDPPIALYERIDRAIQVAHTGPLAGVASDAEFLRRCYLDLIGRIPSITETRAFLNDDAPEKRAQLIDRLLESNEFNTNFAIVFDVMLMERRKDNRVTTAQWRGFLADSLATKKPFDQLAREILASDGSDAKHRPAAKFYLDRDVETHALTRDVSRMFLGRDVQCAQCHDHPLINDYLQEEYYGLFAFLNRSFLFEDTKDNKKAYIGEKAEGQAEFSSVFDPDSGTSLAMPQLTDGLALDGEPRFDGEEAYEVKPANGKRSIPRYSRREQLARLATHTTSEAFARNIVNRLWAHMMGRGIVDPVDLHHAENPPSHPQLLRRLADEFVAMKYDVRAFLKQLALSKTYQRSIDFPVDALDIAGAKAVLNSFAKRKTELEIDCRQFSRAVSSFGQALARERQNVTRVVAELALAQKQIEDSRQAQAAAEKQRQEAEQSLAAKQSQAQILSTAATAAQKAADALPQDKTLADALTTLTTRADSLGKESVSLKATMDKHKTEVEQAATAISRATREMNRLKSQRTALVDLVAEARGAYRVVRSQYARKTDLLEELKQQTAAAQSVVDSSEKLVAQSAASSKVDTISRKLAQLEIERDRIQQALEQHQQELAAAKQELSTARAASETAEEALTRSWTRRFAVKPLKPMSPEQLASSTVIVLGLEARFRREAATEWDGKHKDKKPEEIDNDKKAVEIRQLVEKRVKQVESTFVTLFAAPPASPQDVFSSTVDQALFLANDGRLRSWLQASDGTLVKRLRGLTEPGELGEALYLSAFNRTPTEDEEREVSNYLADRQDDRDGAIKELVWGLLTSLEFRFNH